MAQPTVSIPTTTLTTFAQLSDLLIQAGKLARELSRTKISTTNPAIPVPELKRPKHVPKDQEWFWSEEWQKGEREANEALKRGEYKDFENVESALDYLHNVSHG